MISVNNIAVQFGGTPLFDQISFIINDKDRIGLVGKNGAGKSTLLKIIKGIHSPDQGEVVIPSSQTVGYLPQEMETKSTRTVFDEAMTAFSEVIQLREKIEKLETEIHSRKDYESSEYQQFLHKHAEVSERYNLLEGHLVHVHTQKVLNGLGFETEEFGRPMNQFSSGWQMRVEIAKILLRQPDLLLLDEPTNHLDIESIQWMEEFLSTFKGSVILVSHDRAFLDNVTKRTIEISLGKIYDYKANYSGYIELREERLESQLATYNNQQRQIRQVERFIERFRYKSTKAKQVQSRIKMLDKIEEVELDIFDESAIHFRFPPAPHCGNIILEVKNLVKDYPQKRVLNDLSFTLVKHDRIAFVGKNGEGKTTLSKIIAKVLDFSGEVKFGEKVVIEYYAQDQADFLDPDKTVFQTIDQIATGDIRPKIRTILGGFLFGGEAIDKKVKVLSGGEKSRLSLAKLLLTPSNLLILDEPTNHLDMRSKDILKTALLQYSGTLIIVSHDRDFLQGLTNRVFEFSRGSVREYIGDIYDYLESRKIKSLTQLEAESKKKGIAGTQSEPSVNKLNYEKKKSFEKEIRRLKNIIEKIEAEIERLETEIARTEEILVQPEKFKDKIVGVQVYKEYESLKGLLDVEMKKWEKAHSELQDFEKQKIHEGPRSQ